MMSKIISIITVVVGLILAVLSVTLSPARQHDMILLIHFFEVLLLILLVGAALKYLCCGGSQAQM